MAAIKKPYDEMLAKLTGSLVGATIPITGAPTTQQAAPLAAPAAAPSSSSTTRGLQITGGDNKGWGYDAYVAANGGGAAPAGAGGSWPSGGASEGSAGGSGYQSQYGAQIQSLLDKILNRGQFSYDFNADPLYQQYKDRYMQQGKTAMIDAQAQAAALTGGYGSSYGQQVGQQTYQGYLQGLNDVIPELRGAAFDQYSGETSDMYNQASLLQGLDSADYAKFADDRSYQLQLRQMAQEQAQWQAEFDFQQQKYLDAMAAATAKRRGGTPPTAAATLPKYAEGREFVNSLFKNGYSQSEINASIAGSGADFDAATIAALKDYASGYRADYNQTFYDAKTNIDRWAKSGKYTAAQMTGFLDKRALGADNYADLVRYIQTISG